MFKPLLQAIHFSGVQVYRYQYPLKANELDIKTAFNLPKEEPLSEPELQAFQQAYNLKKRTEKAQQIIAGINQTLGTTECRNLNTSGYAFRRQLNNCNVDIYGLYGPQASWKDILLRYLPKCLTKPQKQPMRLLSYALHHQKEPMTDIVIFSYNAEDSQIANILRQQAKNQGFTGGSPVSSGLDNKDSIYEPYHFQQMSTRWKSIRNAENIRSLLNLQDRVTPKTPKPKAEVPATL